MARLFNVSGGWKCLLDQRKFWLQIPGSQKEGSCSGGVFKRSQKTGSILLMGGVGRAQDGDALEHNLFFFFFWL